MKLTFTIIILFLTTFSGFAQEEPEAEPEGNKGKIYFYWGWNRGTFSNSDINFSGSDYNFTIKEVVADDRQSSFNAKTYFVPGNATIPQYNFRIGYFITDNYNISFGIDHMKYVMRQDQTVKIDGEINNSGTGYDSTYSNDPIQLTEDFLQFEHTDGLNYANFAFRRFDEIYEIYKIKISLTEGLGVGILYPRTNITLLNEERYDEFHLAGYGIDAVVGVNISFLKYFFIQSELKGGYINMPDIRSTNSDSDKASQDFFFSQIMIVFGASIQI
jgi:hypothetical protein